MSNLNSVESVLWDDWHVVAELVRLQLAGRFDTTLLGVTVTVSMDAASGNVDVRRSGEAIAHTEIKYGFVWICLGTPTRAIVDFPECREPDRLTATAGSTGVAV